MFIVVRRVHSEPGDFFDDLVFQKRKRERGPGRTFDVSLPGDPGYQVFRTDGSEVAELFRDMTVPFPSSQG